MSKNVFDISQELMSNAYPGRGIILGRTPDNKKNVIAYFIMGRSENSRNRVFDPVPERGGICTIAATACSPKPRTVSAPRHLTRPRWSIPR